MLIEEVLLKCLMIINGFNKIINLFILRGQNWHLHNFSFFLKHFTDHLIFIFWIFVGLIVTIFGILLSREV